MHEIFCNYLNWHVYLRSNHLCNLVIRRCGVSDVIEFSFTAMVLHLMRNLCWVEENYLEIEGNSFLSCYEWSEVTSFNKQSHQSKYSVQCLVAFVNEWLSCITNCNFQPKRSIASAVHDFVSYLHAAEKYCSTFVKG